MFKEQTAGTQRLSQTAAEALDLEEEAADDKSWPVSATSVASLLCRVQVAHATNGRTRMAHAVDLSGLASRDPKGWSAACGWPLRRGEAWLRRGVVAGPKSSKLGCANWKLRLGTQGDMGD